MDLLYTDTSTLINDRWLLKDQQLQKLVMSMPSDWSFKNFTDTFSKNRFDHQLYQRSFLHVVTETVFKYPSTFVSEKTIKPIANKRPFIMIGPPGSLKNLHSIGFKTFNNFWDEGYDDIEDPELILIAAVDIIEKICNYSIPELQNLCISMKDVLEYNFNYYINDFKKNELKKLEQEIIKNLKPRYV